MTQPALISRTQVIIDWALTMGWDAAQETGWPLFPGPEILAAPDKAIFITTGTGPGYITEEGAADALSFQARVRGPSDNPLAAESAAFQFDALVFAYGQTPAVIDGVRVLTAHRLAGPPVPMPLDPRDRRFEFTCSYVFVTSPPTYVGV